MRRSSARWLRYVSVIAIGITGLWAADIWAAASPAASETVFGTEFARADWDLVMRWLNFIILMALIIKYARNPVILFLKGQKEETARTIQKVEEKKRLAEEKIREGKIQLRASEERLSLIRERIVAEGKRRREQMISDAQAESRMMLAAARTRIDSQIRDAHDTIRGELIDTAFEKAMAKVPQMMTGTDHQQLIQLWVKEAQGL